MKIIAKIGLMVLTLSFACTVQAQERRFAYDVSGVVSTQDRDGNNEGTLGLAAGINYFFRENMGVGLDTWTDGIRFPYMLNASFIYRFPNTTPLVPYAFAGVGRQWQHAVQWAGFFGGGAEYDLKIGPYVFLDGRVVLPADTDTYGLFRLGVRWRF